MSGKRSVFTSLIEKLRDNKRLETSVYAVLIAVVLIIFVSTGGISCPWRKDDNTKAPLSEPEESPADEYKELENKLEDILSRIDGAGKVRVMITYDSGTELVPAVESQITVNQTGSSESKRPVTVSEGGTQLPLVLAELSPRIRGVIVVAEGASDIRVKTELLNAVMTVLGTEPSRISVFSMQH